MSSRTVISLFCRLVPAISLGILLSTPGTAQTNARFVMSPSSARTAGAFPVLIRLENCAAGSTLPAQATVVETGPAVTLTNVVVSDCDLRATLTVRENPEPGTYDLVVVDGATKKTIGVVPFQVTDPLSGPIPRGLTPVVDLSWNVLSYDVCSDDFGKRVAGRFYCIEILIGNNTGFALQLAGIAFEVRQTNLDKQIPRVLLPNNSYLVARSVLQRDQTYGRRNITYRSLNAAGLLATAFLPFFRAPNPRANFSTFTAILGNTLPQGFDSVIPDRTVRQLANLDDQSLRDGVLIANNTQARTVVFVDKASVERPIILVMEEEAGSGAGVQSKGARSGDAELLTTARLAQEAQRKAKRTGFRFTGRSSQLRNDLPVWYVRRALNNLVLIGDTVQYLNRVRVDASAPGTGVQPEPQLDETVEVVDLAQLTPGKTARLVIHGRYLSGAQVNALTPGLENAVKVVGDDPTGRTVTIDLSVPQEFTGTEIALRVGTASGSRTAHVRGVRPQPPVVTSATAAGGALKKDQPVAVTIAGTFLSGATVQMEPADAVEISEVKVDFAKITLTAKAKKDTTATKVTVKVKKGEALAANQPEIPVQ